MVIFTPLKSFFYYGFGQWFECLKGLLGRLWVGTVIIKHYSILKGKSCLQFWGGDAVSKEIHFVTGFSKMMVLCALRWFPFSCETRLEWTPANIYITETKTQLHTVAPVETKPSTAPANPNHNAQNPHRALSAALSGPDCAALRRTVWFCCRVWLFDCTSYSDRKEIMLFSAPESMPALYHVQYLGGSDCEFAELLQNRNKP